MPAYRTQDDLIDYITKLEQRVARLEQSAVRIDQTGNRASSVASKGRIIFDTSTNKLYAGDGSRDSAGSPYTTAWNALW